MFLFYLFSSPQKFSVAGEYVKCYLSPSVSDSNMVVVVVWVVVVGGGSPVRADDMSPLL